MDSKKGKKMFIKSALRNMTVYCMEHTCKRMWGMKNVGCGTKDRDFFIIINTLFKETSFDGFTSLHILHKSYQGRVRTRTPMNPEAFTCNCTGIGLPALDGTLILARRCPGHFPDIVINDIHTITVLEEEYTRTNTCLDFSRKPVVYIICLNPKYRVHAWVKFTVD